MKLIFWLVVAVVVYVALTQPDGENRNMEAPENSAQTSRETAVYDTYNGLNTTDPNFDVGGYCLEKERMGGISFEECLGVAAAKIMSQRK